MMVLLCCLVAACNSFAFTQSYAPGRDNAVADALSRVDFQLFHHLAPHVAHMATPKPPWLVAYFLSSDWKVPILLG